MAELVTFGETMLRLSPPPGDRLESPGDLEAAVGGAESNVAIAAGCLGAEAAWLSKLPANPLGRRVVRALRAAGVEPVVAWDDRPAARLGIYYLEHGAEPRPTSVVYDRANAAITTVAPADLAVDRVASAAVFHTTGITPALSPAAAETTDALLETAGAAGTLRSFDLNYRGKLWDPAEAAAAYERILPAVDLLFAPIRDAERVLGYDGDGEAVARALAAGYDLDAVVVTLGGDGSLALVDGAVRETDVFDADTVDAIGTGDAFVGGILGALLTDAAGDASGADGTADAPPLTSDRLADALAYGAAAAALKRTLTGDVLTATRAEIEAVLERDGGGISR